MPADQTVAGVRIALVIVGIAITIPAFLVAGQLLGNLGFQRGISAIAIGGVIVAAMATMTMRIAARTGLSTYTLISGPFGLLGARLLGGLVALTLLGWFGATAHLFGQALASALEVGFDLAVPGWPLTLMGGGLMIVTTVYGFQAIERLSRFAVPLLLALLGYVLFAVTQAAPSSSLWEVSGSAESIQSVGQGISLVVGAFMVAVTIAPDIARFARSQGQAALAACLGFGVGYVAVLILAGLPSLLSDEGGYIEQLLALGLGAPALLVIVFATWTTNVSNLYSASLGFARALPAVSETGLIVGLGVIGTGLALLGMADRLVPFLVLLSVIVPPISGIYVVHYLFLRREPTSHGRVSRAACASLVMAVGLTSSAAAVGLDVTGILSLDSWLIAAFGYALSSKVLR